jgi:hypothetical protein
LAGKTLDIEALGVNPDKLACEITNEWNRYNTLRQTKVAEWNEIRRYVYATDTTQTTNSKLPWKNKTTIPKLCQIRDNLYANYMASLFPKRKWLYWEGDRDEDETAGKIEAIEGFMEWSIDRSDFKKEVGKLVQDYIDYGNCFATVDWVDNNRFLADKQQVGYVGPIPRRISPLDIVFNPIASSFEASPKIVRSMVTIGELKKMLDAESTSESKADVQAILDYLFEYRKEAASGSTGYDLSEKDSYLNVDGFTSWRDYLGSNYIELLTFYGDLYDVDGGELLQNHVITVVDRHKLISKKPNPSYFGTSPIWHAGWRPRQDNLWAMGPLDNLVGMQYRIDHLENLKADIMDLITFPVLKIKGYVDEFEWGPMEKIYVGDDGDVEMVMPPYQALQLNSEIANLASTMEEMAGSPKEAMGIRTPGEKTAYEVQRLESAAGRIFQAKISQFEEQIVEYILNGMLELARRIMGPTVVRGFNDEVKIATFRQLTANDITGQGRLRPLAARHFAEKAEVIQNLTQLTGSGLWADEEFRLHFSSVKMADMVEELLNLEDYKVVNSYIRLSERADAQRQMNSMEEQVTMEAATPSGLSPDDSDEMPMSAVGGMG